MRAAIDLLLQSRSLLPEAQAVLLVNKLDLVERWEVAASTLAELRKTLPVIETSALAGTGVEEAFVELARKVGA
jgi:Ni2+-binding GTPase involved in maturation of urease and hydrogenase